MATTEVSVGLAAKLSDAYVAVGATPEVINWLCENRHALVDAVEMAKLKIERKHRVETLDAIPIRPIASFNPEDEYGLLGIYDSRLHLSDGAKTVLHSRTPSVIGGSLSAIKLKRPANYRHVKNYLTSSPLLGHIYQFVCQVLKTFDGIRVEHHFFLTTFTQRVPGEHGPLDMQIGIRVAVETEGVWIDTVYVNDKTFFSETAILHSFTPD